jgi:Na+/melibiose symporter-like transporter
MPNAALTLAISVFMTPYLTGYVGLTLGAVAFTFGAVRLLDLGVDFLLGLAMDRTRTRIGRYRPWMILGAPVVMAAVYLLFMARPGATTGYLIAALLLMYLGTSILALSHTAWASTLATNYDDRSRLFGALTAVGVIASVAVLLVPVILLIFSTMYLRYHYVVDVVCGFLLAFAVLRWGRPLESRLRADTETTGS